MYRVGLFSIGLMLLVGCGNKPTNYLALSQPVLNVDAKVADQINVDLSPRQVTFYNKSDLIQSLKYTITWYDKEGVTQFIDWQQTDPVWHDLTLVAKQRYTHDLIRPTNNSITYRVYVANNHD